MLIKISDIVVEVRKKNIKNLHLSVKPPNGDVIVSAPLEMNDEAIQRFVSMRIFWVKKQILKYKNQLRQSKREYISGETLYLWGKQYYLQIKIGSKNSILLSSNKAIFTVRKESTIDQREKFIREWYRSLLKEEIERLLPKWEKITGLKAISWQIKNMTTRWGTCNTEKGKLWFNLQLAKKSQACLEYIILHELIHLEEKTHNVRFISKMDKFMPMWREVKVTLNGQILEFLE